MLLLAEVNEKFILIINIVLYAAAVCTVPPATSHSLHGMMMLLRNIHFAALYRNKAIDIQSKKFI